MIERNAIYVAGAWVPSGGTGTIDVYGASTEEVVGRIPDGVADDVDRAVGAAKAAFPEWSATAPEERAKHLQRIQEGLFARQDELAQLIATEVGMPLKLAAMIQVGLPSAQVGNYAQILRDFRFEEEIGHSLVVREPIGVVGCITPWNYPLNQIIAKVAPALAAGCTVVLKPSEVAPLNAFVLADVIDEAGLPPGVFNLVSGVGPVVGEAIAAHPDVDMVSFTGSTRAGKRVAELAAASVKRVAVKAVSAGVTNCYLNSGQTCTAWTRMLVPRDRLAEAEQIAAARAERYRVGDPLVDGTNLGPLISDVQRDRVRGYIEKGIAEGAKLVTGGAEPPDGLEKGYFVRPTVFSEVTPDMTIAQEEIFGPVLSIIPYDTEDQAVEIANGTIYGLAGGVWSGDQAHAEQVARRLRTGQVDINGAMYNPLAPFGGYKQSGVGRENGRIGFEEFLETKSLQR